MRGEGLVAASLLKVKVTQLFPTCCDRMDCSPPGPMVEIDEMKLVQNRAILNYIATKYDLHGKDMKERALYGIFSVLS